VQEISEITRALKGLAKELDLPVIALSQLSRAVEQREDKKPQLSDLRESGTIDKNWRIGVEFIYSQLKTALENNGIVPIDAIGVEFDPNKHEPIETKETDDATLDHKIERIIQKGYQMGERVIRPARVVVWKTRG
jgi:molecular chaperone GrpE (heat shock protein)